MCQQGIREESENESTGDPLIADVCRNLSRADSARGWARTYQAGRRVDYYIRAVLLYILNERRALKPETLTRLAGDENEIVRDLASRLNRLQVRPSRQCGRPAVHSGKD